MILIPHFRQGIGFDIEYNEDICHIMETDKGEYLFSFSGMIVMLPFIKIYIGDMDIVCEMKEDIS